MESHPKLTGIFFSLASNGKKSKGTKAQGKAESNTNHGKKKDLSKIKCFHCHEYGHYGSKCPHKTSSKEPTTGVGGDSLTSQFYLDFTLIACMEIIVRGSEWYLDFGASCHM